MACNPQIGLLCFSDFYDFNTFVCGNCRYGDFNVLMFLGFWDLGNCPFPGISNFVVIYTTGILFPGKNACPQNFGHAKVPK